MSDGFELVNESELETAVREIDAAVALADAAQAGAGSGVSPSQPVAKAKAKAAPKAAAPRSTGRASGPPRTVAGPHPVAPSSTGRSYYLLLSSTPPTVASGYAVALRELGGSWTGRGRIPEGFASIEAALNAAAAAGHNEARILW